MRWVYVFRQNGTQMLDETELDVKKLYEVGINHNCINLRFSFVQSAAMLHTKGENTTKQGSKVMAYHFSPHH